MAIKAPGIFTSNLHGHHKPMAPTKPQEVEKLGPPKWTVIESFLLGVRVVRVSEGCMCLLGLLSKLDSLVLSCICPKPITN